MVGRFTFLLSKVAVLSILIASSKLAAQQIPAQNLGGEPPINFSLASFDGSWINAIGRFDEGALERFREFLEFNKEVRAGATVQLLSNGGSLLSGMKIGAMIQAHGFNTVVGDTKYLSGRPICASACTLAFIGGIHRHVEPQAEFLVHATRLLRSNGSEYLPDEIVFSPRDLALEQSSMSLVLRYARNQGVDPAAVAAMYNVFPYGAPEESSRRLTSYELTLWRIDNLVPLSQETQQVMQPVDRLRQELCPPIKP